MITETRRLCRSFQVSLIDVSVSGCSPGVNMIISGSLPNIQSRSGQRTKYVRNIQDSQGKKRDRKKDERYAEKNLSKIMMKVCERKTCRKECRRRRRLGRQSQWQETQRWLKKKVKVKDEQQRPPGCDWGRNSKLKTYRF